MGIPTVRVKLLAYAIGAAFGGVAGTFLGSFLSTVNADQFEFSFSIFVLAMIILGGLGTSGGWSWARSTLSFINTRLIPDVLNERAEQDRARLRPHRSSASGSSASCS